MLIMVDILMAIPPPVNPNNPIQKMLVGEGAFYKQANYEQVTKQELTSSKALPPVYKHTIESKVWRVVKDIFSVIFFPLGIYRLIHMAVGKAIIVPAATPQKLGYRPDYAIHQRSNIVVDQQDEWKMKRLSIKVDGYIIDAAIIGRESTFGNGRWVLESNGNGEFYEDKLNNHSFKQILSKLEGNAIVFNYPGVGSSSGMPDRKAMEKAYRAMLTFLEDKEKGIGAKEIIGHGHSIGGGVQGEALQHHKMKDGTKYVYVKSRTFSNLSKVPNHKVLSFATKLFGWDISSVESSKKLKAPEIIIQTAYVSAPTDLAESSAIPVAKNQAHKIRDDGIISRDASLAKKLLDDNATENKYFMGVREGHNEELANPDELVDKIKEMLDNQ